MVDACAHRPNPLSGLALGDKVLVQGGQLYQITLFELAQLICAG